MISGTKPSKDTRIVTHHANSGGKSGSSSLPSLAGFSGTAGRVEGLTKTWSEKPGGSFGLLSEKVPLILCVQLSLHQE